MTTSQSRPQHSPRERTRPTAQRGRATFPFAREGVEMPFALVTTVRIEDPDDAHRQKYLNEWVIPRLKATAGFQSARFLRSQDRTTGVGVVRFDTETNAKAALDAMANAERPAEAPKLESTSILEVIVEV